MRPLSLSIYIYIYIYMHNELIRISESRSNLDEAVAFPFALMPFSKACINLFFFQL